MVNEIIAVTLSDEKNSYNANPNDDVTIPSNLVLQDRSFIANKCFRNGDARYCIKKISDKTYKNKERYFDGVLDLAIEMKVLAILKHPNIIKMRAIAEGDPFRRENFVVLDRLYDTLKTRLIKWRKTADKPWNKFKKRSQKLLMNRIEIAYDLSAAFKYLHEHK